MLEIREELLPTYRLPNVTHNKNMTPRGSSDHEAFAHHGRCKDNSPGPNVNQSAEMSMLLSRETSLPMRGFRSSSITAKDCLGNGSRQ
jgi:hypothetical protein